MVKKVWQTDGRTDRQTDGLNQSYSCLVAAKKRTRISHWFQYSNGFLKSFESLHAHYKIWDEITYPFQTSTVAPLKFGNELVISSHTMAVSTYPCLYLTQTARFTWPTWGQPGSCRPQVGPMLAPWSLLSGKLIHVSKICPCECNG